MGEHKKSSVSQNLGAFFGHIFGAIKNDPNAPQTTQVKKEVTEETRDDGVVLRRTTIDEVILPPDSKPPDAQPPKN